MGASSSSAADWPRRGPPSNCAAPSTPARSRSSATRTICRTTGRRCRRKCCAPRPTTSRSSRAEFYDENDITVRLGSAATALDTAAQTVTLADGDVARLRRTGHRDRPGAQAHSVLPGSRGHPRAALASSESMALREHAGSAERAVVVGAGFIGCEVAASLRRLGVDVVFGRAAARRRWRRCSASRSVSWWPGCTAPRVSTCAAASGSPRSRGTDHVEKVVLSDGTELDADLVVVGIGSRPATDWLEGSGIEVDNGVVCDDAGPHQRAERVGDRRCRIVAGRRRDTKSRVEHWSNVAEQARVIVPAMLGRRGHRGGRRCPTSGATSTTSRSSASASRRPTTSCTSSRTTAASSWPTTSATAWSSAWSAAACRAR